MSTTSPVAVPPARGTARAAALARALLGLLAAAGVLVGCATLVPKLHAPQFALTGIELRGGTVAHERLGLRLHATNPNSRAIAVRRIDFAVELNGAQVATGHTAAAFVLPAGGMSDIDVDVSADLRRVAGALLLGIGRRPIPYRIHGTVHLRATILRALPFDARGTLH